MAKSTLPTPVRTDSRICFALAWFTSKKDADTFAADVKRRGVTYNGGFFHGMPCGRAKEFDYEKDGVKYYAVTN